MVVVNGGYLFSVFLDLICPLKDKGISDSWMHYTTL